MKLRDILLSIERDEYIEPSHLTVGDWLEEWFRIYCLPHKKASTCTGYEEEIYLHLKPYIGRVPLQELKAQHVQAAINPANQQRLQKLIDDRKAQQAATE